MRTWRAGVILWNLVVSDNTVTANLANPIVSGLALWPVQSTGQDALNVCYCVCKAACSDWRDILPGGCPPLGGHSRVGI